jgi:hypothetical protein
MVKFSRRNFLRGASGAAALPVLSRAVSAQAYPTLGHPASCARFC